MFGLGSILGLIGNKFNLQEVIKKLITGGMSEEEALNEALGQRKKHKLEKAGGLIDAVGEGFGNTFSTIQSIFAPRKQMKMQKELMQEQAKLNYEYGERAAQNAYEREQAIYQQSKQDNSFAARKADAMGAGLSPGVLYGSTGASGGGAGSTGGGKMGATGTSGGAAPDSTAGIQTLLGLRQVKLQERKNTAEVKLIESQAKEAEASAAAKQAQADTENKMRNIRAGIEWLTGKDMARDLLIKLMYDKTEPYDYKEGSPSVEIMKFGNELGGQFGDFAFDKRGYTMVGKSQEIDMMDRQITKAIEETNKIISEKELNTEKKRGYWEELRIAALNGNAAMVNAIAHKLAAEWDTGEYTNWKTWVEMGYKAADIVKQYIPKAKVITK